MEFKIENVVDVGKHDGVRSVEVRARLADGRLACLTLPRGTQDSYSASVKAYVAEHILTDEELKAREAATD